MTSDTQVTVAFDPLDQNLRFADLCHERIRGAGGIAWTSSTEPRHIPVRLG